MYKLARFYEVARASILFTCTRRGLFRINRPPARGEPPASRRGARKCPGCRLGSLSRAGLSRARSACNMSPRLRFEDPVDEDAEVGTLAPRLKVPLVLLRARVHELHAPQPRGAVLIALEVEVA